MSKKKWLSSDELAEMRRRAMDVMSAGDGVSIRADVLRLADEVDALRTTVRNVRDAMRELISSCGDSSTKVKLSTLKGWSEDRMDEEGRADTPDTGEAPVAARPLEATPATGIAPTDDAWAKSHAETSSKKIELRLEGRDK